MTSAVDEHEVFQRRLQNFITRHTAHHRPLALVTSGGTKSDLEKNAVRYLDNFSTGLRGAVSVEHFLKRGYAVVHLQREGSASPFGRVLSDALSGALEGRNLAGGKSVAHHGLTFESLGRLFDCEDLKADPHDRSLLGIDFDSDYSGEVANQSGKNAKGNEQRSFESNSADPWMYSILKEDSTQPSSEPIPFSCNKQRGYLSLNPRLIHSHQLQSALRERNRIVRQGLLLTITFQTVDEYLSNLQMCAQALHACGTLGLVYLAAAVSDFYIPMKKRQLHKIQSRDYGLQPSSSSLTSDPSFGDGRNVTKSDGDEGSSVDQFHFGANNTLTLTLYPVPKAIPKLREEWCPMAFIVSFKLETDPSILRQKSVIAMKSNNVHLVIGNDLATRHERVWILSRKSDLINAADGDDRASVDDIYGADKLPEGYQVSEINCSHNTYLSRSSQVNSIDALEHATIDSVVRHHFLHISHQLSPSIHSTITMQPKISSLNHSNKDLRPSSDRSAAEIAVYGTANAVTRHKAWLAETSRNLRRKKWKAHAKEMAWNIAGSAIGMALSYGVARVLQRQNLSKVS